MEDAVDCDDSWTDLFMIVPAARDTFFREFAGGMQLAEPENQT
jgi:hypothetical protein